MDERDRDEHWYKNMQMIGKSIMGQKGQKANGEILREFSYCTKSRLKLYNN